MENQQNRYKGVVHDDQTNQVFIMLRETRWDSFFAIMSLLYLLVVLAFLLWQLFDVWVGSYTLAKALGYTALTNLASQSFRLTFYAFIGGGLGGFVNGVRSILLWFADRTAFGKRYFWRYLGEPWVGGVLAVVALAILRSGIAVLGGDFKVDDVSTRLSLTILALGALAGYGSRLLLVD